MSVDVCDLSELCVTSNDPSRSKNIRERANQELFCENFQNDSTDKFSRLEKRVKSITEDNGVRIESPFEKEGLGLTVREFYAKEQARTKKCGNQLVVWSIIKQLYKAKMIEKCGEKVKKPSEVKRGKEKARTNIQEHC